MSYTLVYPQTYLLRVKSFFKKHPELLKRYEKTLVLLERNPHHPSLRLHRLQGSLKDFHSVSINMKYRITLELIIKEKEIILANIGPHDQVYKH